MYLTIIHKVGRSFLIWLRVETTWEQFKAKVEEKYRSTDTDAICINYRQLN